MIIVQRPFVKSKEQQDGRFSYNFYIVLENEYDLYFELDLIKSRLIKDTDDRPISNQGQDIR